MIVKAVEVYNRVVWLPQGQADSPESCHLDRTWQRPSLSQPHKYGLSLSYVQPQERSSDGVDHLAYK